MRASFVLSGVATGVRRNLTMTVALVLSTAIALGFVGAAILANIEISRFKTVYESKLNVSVYLCTNNAYDLEAKNYKEHTRKLAPTCSKGKETSAAQITAIQSALTSDPRVKKVVFISADKNLKAARQAQPTLANFLQPGDFPSSFTITLKNLTADYPLIQAKFGAMAGVDQVQNQFGVIKKLLDIINSARTFSIAVAVLVLVASILLIGNTIQVAAAQRQNETSIMRLVGASRWMTELPFMLETIIAVVIGGIISTVMIWVGKDYILGSVFRFPVSNGVIPNLGINDVLVAGGLGLITGLVLSAITAIVTLRVYVRL
jgi:cell division transport system permease protein